ncbi:hypothetical protein CEP10_08515 [Cylindrospermopsis raciborskii S07]|jgi:hypothetical protein|uniref:Uncharacterized protein n=4 Tax=Aphanizomenonaceae TaxID=1892259 RepID=A0A853M777_9CYAN|nr:MULTISPECIES: hypothetical protein [Cylindrospermopsis]MBU6344746.1 hypothetical protein [Cyanobacteria bacterium REEB494]KRH95990.1 hypothetical protein ASL19_08715 [Cylindrospermopsis sp. CR12]MBA4445402.1 hypothetical protein [Cylindrospermopsis raciborskii CS-506_C]MBA4449638.1 hypothetical protein [Cylindrospermopsis raciborskii CS-506_D]MBA4456260.1 hypothetical protein [Cylindrospermopsis raciborskii CS-506_B]
MSTLSSSVATCESHSELVKKLTKAYYQDEQQEKFIGLQTEIDSLLQHLQNLKIENLKTNH